MHGRIRVSDKIWLGPNFSANVQRPLRNISSSHTHAIRLSNVTYVLFLDANRTKSDYYQKYTDTMTTPKPHIAHTLLTRAHSPDTADTLFTERIKQRPLFLRPTSPTPDDNRNRRRLHRLRKKEYFLRKQKPKPLSAREKRKTGIHDLRPEECKYEVFRGLHAMWVEYMQEILDLKGQSQGGQGQPPVTSLSHGSKLVSADFHGAEIEVVKSRCSGRVGLKGIVVRDTKFTFVVVTKGDEVKSEFLSLFFSVPLHIPTSGMKLSR